MKKQNEKMHMILLTMTILFVAIFGVAASAEAANHYVRQGAGGSGGDWTNAYSDLPSTLTRGDTYYVADGTYSSHTLR